MGSRLFVAFMARVGMASSLAPIFAFWDAAKALQTAWHVVAELRDAEPDLLTTGSELLIALDSVLSVLTAIDVQFKMQPPKRSPGVVKAPLSTLKRSQSQAGLTKTVVGVKRECVTS